MTFLMKAIQGGDKAPLRELRRGDGRAHALFAARNQRLSGWHASALCLACELAAMPPSHGWDARAVKRGPP